MSRDEVRDARGGRFWMDDSVVDRYGADLGPFGLAVYMILARRAGKNGRSHPSVRRIAEDVGISERQAKRELKKLRDLGLIKVEARREDGRQTSSVYTLLEVSRVPVSHPEQSLQSDSETPGGEGSVSHPKEDTVKKEGVEANASSGQGRSQANVVGLEKHIVDEIYKAMSGEGLRLPNEHFAYHLGRAQDVIAKDGPTDEEIEDLPATFVRAWKIWGKADAHTALMEMRRQKARGEVLNESQGYFEQPHPQGPEAEAARDKPRDPMWYSAFYDVSEAAVERWVGEGESHSEIMARLEAREAGAA